MKRTTIVLENQIFARTKQLCKEQGRTLKEVINDLLRVALNTLPAKKPKKFKMPLHRNNGPLPGGDIADRNALYDLMDDIK